MHVPADLHFTKEHEWVRDADGVATVGITDFAQDALGDVVFVSLPEVGAHVVAGAVLGEIESTKSVSELYAPVTGSVKSVNDALRDAPEQLNADPYGEGWICTIEMHDAGQLEVLLDAAAYTTLTDS